MGRRRTDHELGIGAGLERDRIFAGLEELGALSWWAFAAETDAMVGAGSAVAAAAVSLGPLVAGLEVDPGAGLVVGDAVERGPALLQAVSSATVAIAAATVRTRCTRIPA